MHKPIAIPLAVQTFLLLLICRPMLPPPAAAASALEPSVTVQFARPKWEPCLPFVPKGCEVALVKGDFTRGGSQIVYRMPANFSVPAHWHTSAERMVVMAGKIRMTYDGRAPEVLETGDSAEAPGKLPHAAFCLRGTPCVVLVEYALPFDATPVALPR